jgi:hypothetical protein
MTWESKNRTNDQKKLNIKNWKKVYLCCFRIAHFIRW